MIWTSTNRNPENRPYLRRFRILKVHAVQRILDKLWPFVCAFLFPPLHLEGFATNRAFDGVDSEKSSILTNLVLLSFFDFVTFCF